MQTTTKCFVFIAHWWFKHVHMMHETQPRNGLCINMYRSIYIGSGGGFIYRIVHLWSAPRHWYIVLVHLWSAPRHWYIVLYICNQHHVIDISYCTFVISTTSWYIVLYICDQHHVIDISYCTFVISTTSLIYRIVHLSSAPPHWYIVLYICDQQHGIDISYCTFVINTTSLIYRIVHL